MFLKKVNTFIGRQFVNFLSSIFINIQKILVSATELTFLESETKAPKELLNVSDNYIHTSKAPNALPQLARQYSRPSNDLRSIYRKKHEFLIHICEGSIAKANLLDLLVGWWQHSHYSLGDNQKI